jgi:short-subunit dehydrogenase
MLDLKGKRTLVTGASSGIGKELALEFARKGAAVALASRRLDRLEEIAGDIRRACPWAPAPLAVGCDVTDRDEVARLVETCRECLGGIDILVNNAGAGVYGETARTSVEDIRAIMEVNFYGALNCLFEVLATMKEARDGLIVNISTAAALHGVPYLAAYGASKAALAVFSQSLRAEISGSGVAVMVVYPGYTETEFFAREKRVGGARRPHRPYAPARRVARLIVRAIEREKAECVLSREGRAIALARKYFPRLAEWAMVRVAARLRESKETGNEHA